jgi:hypothetical protein
MFIVVNGHQRFVTTIFWIKPGAKKVGDRMLAQETTTGSVAQ